MWARDISVDDLTAAVKERHELHGRGTVRQRERHDVVAAARTARQRPGYSDLIVGSKNGAPIYLRDVAEVRDSVQDERLNMRFWARGYPVPGATVVLAVYRQAGANAVEVANSIRALLPQISAELPGSVLHHAALRPLARHR